MFVYIKTYHVSLAGGREERACPKYILQSDCEKFSRFPASNEGKPHCDSLAETKFGAFVNR